MLEIKRRVEPEAIADACRVVAGCDSRNLLRSSGESGVKWVGGLSYKVLMGVLGPSAQLSFPFFPEFSQRQGGGNT